MSARMGLVRLAGKPVGVIKESNGDTEFTYTPKWLAQPNSTPISMTLPLRREPYRVKGLHPFFENLLPEGWLLEVSSKQLKISKDDPFGLLLATCGDCIGTVEVGPMELEAR